MEQVRKVLLEYDLIDQNDYTSKKISDIFKEIAAAIREVSINSESSNE